MASKIPAFGEWGEGKGGENITVGFVNARKKKKKSTNGHMINPNNNNEPQDNPPSNYRLALAAADPNGKCRGIIPKFGGWENYGDNVGVLGYTQAFDNALIIKKGQPTSSANKPHININSKMNQDMQPASQPRAQPQPKPAKFEPLPEKQPNVPKFCCWDGCEGNSSYTECFDTIRDNTKNNRHNFSPESSFGACKEGNNGRKKTNAKPAEPEHNRDINNTVGETKNKVDDHHLKISSTRYDASVGLSSDSTTKCGKHNFRARPYINLRGERQRLNQKPLASQGSQIPKQKVAVPVYGGWRKDPSQAKDITGAFVKAKEDRDKPIHIQTYVPLGPPRQPPPQRYHEYSNPPKPKHIIRRQRLAW